MSRLLGLDRTASAVHEREVETKESRRLELSRTVMSRQLELNWTASAMLERETVESRRLRVSRTADCSVARRSTAGIEPDEKWSTAGLSRTEKRSVAFTAGSGERAESSIDGCQERRGCEEPAEGREPQEER